MGGLGTEPGRAEAGQGLPSDANGRRPAVYFWARTMTCPNPACQAEIPLLSSFWLANSTRHKAWVEVNGDRARSTLASGPAASRRDPLSDGTVKASSVTCPGCGTSMIAKEVREYATKDRLRPTPLCSPRCRRRSQNVPCADRPRDRAERKGWRQHYWSELEETPDGTSALPTSHARSRSSVSSEAWFTASTPSAGSFNDRQLYVLGSLCEAVRAAMLEMLAEGMQPERARRSRDLSRILR